MRKVTTVNQKQKVTSSSSLTALMYLRAKIRKEANIKTLDQVEMQNQNQRKDVRKTEVTVTKQRILTRQRFTVILTLVKNL